MMLKIPRSFLAAVLACGCLSGCRSDFHLLLFNDTDDTIVIQHRESDRTPMVVVAGISGEITGVSTENFSVERGGKTLHYRFPPAYTFPSASVPSGYERKVPKIGRCFYFQLAPDDRIYILRRHDVLATSHPPAQPAGFPLVPR